MIIRILKILGIIVGGYVVSCGILYIAGFRYYVSSGEDMKPTIERGERFFGRLSEGYRKKVARFDLVIFTRPDSLGILFTKRTIGLPGERIAIDDSGVTINGERLALPPSVSIGGFRAKKASFTIPDDAIFVLGDFTENSLDSRYYGSIPLKAVVGRVVFEK